MKYFLMSGQINDDQLHKFIEFHNSNHDVPVSIVVNSRGGYTDIAHIILHMISQMSDVTIIIVNAFSCAFDICYLSKGKKMLSIAARGMYHLPSLTVEMAVSNQPYYSDDKNLVKNLKYYKEISDRIAKETMTTLEYSKYKKTDEVWFDFARMKQLFPGATVI